VAIFFETVTECGKSVEEMFDLARNIDVEPTANGSVMIDRIHVVAPFGALGRLAEKLVLARYLRQLIRDRGEYLAAL
jgi:hypothetical protein